MQITTQWLTPAKVERTRESSITTAQTMVQLAFPDWPQGRTDALLDASMTLWGRGPLIAANTLVRAAELITTAWGMREHIAGVMLMRSAEGFTPLYLHQHALALKMQSLLANGQELSREMTRELKLRGVSNGAFNRVNIEHTAIWFGILVLIVVEVGLITPPVGMNLFVINAMDRETPMVETYKAVLYFVASDLVRVALLMAFPVITLMLLPK